MCHSEHKTKKVYRERHAMAKTKPYKRDKSNNRFNPAYVRDQGDEYGEEGEW